MINGQTYRSDAWQWVTGTIYVYHLDLPHNDLASKKRTSKVPELEVGDCHRAGRMELLGPRLDIPPRTA